MIEKNIPTPGTGGSHVLKLTIEGKQFEWSEQYITGAQLKHLAGLAPDSELYLSLVDPWDDELISNDEKVDLAREGIEAFYVRKPLKFLIDNKQFEWKSQYIIGKQVRRLGQIPADAEIYLEIAGPHQDELITDETVVDLARPGIEHFVTVEKQVAIIVNGREHAWDQKKITYDQVVRFAFGNPEENRSYTVTYIRGPKQNPSGEMSPGDTVYVKNKMVFNVTATVQS